VPCKIAYNVSCTLGIRDC